jgi:SAM-dependent methyltransferase
MDWATLSPDDALKLNTYDFLAWLGKRVINPGGIKGRDQVLDRVQPSPDSHLLEIGGGSGHAACHIAQKYGCRVTSIDISPRSVREAQALVKRLGLDGQVRCEVGDVNDLRFKDNTFDAAICQAVIMFVPHQHALSEARRVLKEGGIFAGLEFCWRRLPPDAVREATYRICGCATLDFHSLYGWIGALREASFETVHATEHAFNLLSPKGFIRDEGWTNSLRIAAKVLSQRANRVRMTEIWSHFSNNIDYFSYVVFSGGKQTVCNVQQRRMGNAA